MAAFTTHLSLGQVAYAVQGNGLDFFVGRVTVGQIRVTETAPKLRASWDDSPLFKEEYMCVETGVSSGSIWTFGKNIFATEADAMAGVRAYEQAAHKERAERDAYQEKQRIQREEEERRQLARLQEKYGAAT